MLAATACDKVSVMRTPLAMFAQTGVQVMQWTAEKHG